MLPNYSEIMDLIKKGANLEAQEKILELREAALSIQQENVELKQKVKLLEDRLGVRDSVVWQRPHYWTEDEEGTTDGPYCQKCYDDSSKLIRLQGGQNDTWRCLVCDKTIIGPNYKHPEVRTRGY